MTSKSIIHFKNIHKSYNAEGVQFKALNGISLDIHRGEFLGICGKSGSGKTSLLNLAGLIDRPNSGSLVISGQETTTITDNELSDLRSKEIGFIFQTFNLLPMLSAMENVEYPLMLIGVNEQERKVRALDALKEVGIEQFAHHRPSQLSGGQRQRVAIARALVKKPTIILADEPTANLDSKTSNEVFNLLIKLQNDHHITVLLCSHDLDLISKTNRVIKIADGEIIEETVK